MAEPQALAATGTGAPAEAAETAEAAPADGHEHATGCSCPEGKAGGTTWCEDCGVGYIGGEKTTDKAAYDAAASEAPAEEAPAEEAPAEEAPAE